MEKSNVKNSMKSIEICNYASTIQKQYVSDALGMASMAVNPDKKVLDFYPDPSMYSTCGMFESGLHHWTLYQSQQHHRSLIWSPRGKIMTSRTCLIFSTFAISHKHSHGNKIGHNQGFCASIQTVHFRYVLPWG